MVLDFYDSEAFLKVCTEFNLICDLGQAAGSPAFWGPDTQINVFTSIYHEIGSFPLFSPRNSHLTAFLIPLLSSPSILIFILSHLSSL